MEDEASASSDNLHTFILHFPEVYLIFQLYTFHRKFKDLYDYKIRSNVIDRRQVRDIGYYRGLVGICIVQNIYRNVALYDIKILMNQKDIINEKNIDY